MASGTLRLPIGTTASVAGGRELAQDKESSWTASYRNSADTRYNRMLLFEADSALVTPAVKLDVLGIAVNRFPGDQPPAS